MVRQVHLIAVVVGTFLIGCAVLLLVVSCAGTSSEAPQEKGKGHTETTKKDQTRSSEATASEEQARCEGTRTHRKGRFYSVKRERTEPLVVTTNDLPDCPKGGLLLGTDKADTPYSQPSLPGLDGQDGDDEIRGLGGEDALFGGPGNDVIYGGDGNDVIEVGKGEDVIYGGDGNDTLLIANGDGQRDKLYCGRGKDHYLADKKDYVDSSCEEKIVGAGA